MRFTYDLRHNIAYIRFQAESSDVQSIGISDELIVDTAPNGRVYGIELLNATQQLQRESGDKFLIVNEETGGEVDVRLTRF